MCEAIFGFSASLLQKRFGSRACRPFWVRSCSALKAFTHRTPDYAQVQNAPIVESMAPVTLPTGEKLDARIKYYWFGVAEVELITAIQMQFDSLCTRNLSPG